MIDNLTVARAAGLFRAGDDKGFQALCREMGAKPADVLLAIKEPGNAELKAFPPESTITCRVCRRGETVSLDNPILLCSVCRGNLPGAERRINAALAALAVQENTYAAEWAERLETLDENTADRWSRLVTQRNAARGALERALVGRFGKNVTPSEVLEIIAQARAALATIEDKVRRTKEAEGNPLSAILKAEDGYLKERAALAEQRAELEIALAEIAAAQGELPL